MEGDSEKTKSHISTTGLTMKEWPRLSHGRIERHFINQEDYEKLEENKKRRQVLDMIHLTIFDHAHLVHAHWLAFCIYMLVRYVKRDFYTHN